MNPIFKSGEGGRLVRERYQAFLQHWPVPNEQLHIPTTQGSTFVVVSGPKDAPPLLLLHGSAANSAMWLGDVRIFARAFRVYCIDMIGEPGFSAPGDHHFALMPTQSGWTMSSTISPSIAHL